MSLEYSSGCSRCQMGRYFVDESTYVQMFRGRVLVACDVLSYVCDICGHCEFDADALHQLFIMSGQLDDRLTANARDRRSHLKLDEAESNDGLLSG